MKKKRFKMIIVLTILVALFFLVDDRAYIIARSAGYKTLRVFAYYKSTEFSSDKSIINKPHFTIINRGSDEEIADFIGELLEKSYSLIGEEFDYYPNYNIPVFVYGSMEEFWEYNKALKGQAVMGLYNLGVIHIVAPHAFSMTLEEYESSGTVLHEYTHLVIDDLTGGNVEIWFTEGMALFQEYNIYGAEWGKFMDDVDYSLEDLRANFMGLDSDKAYRKAFLIVKDIYSNIGKDGVLDLLKELRVGKNFNKVAKLVEE
ncbi:MAG: hypothetical protein GX201_06405 [Clostridiales bacterium]|nr:hypothetical protein [Clostridiales bacterium]